VQANGNPAGLAQRTPTSLTGAHLITGGLGGLGLEVARWLVEQGAQYLVLNGRQSPAPEALTVIERLRQKGADVELVLGDIADASTVEKLLQQVQHSGRHFEGVFHLAGVLRDGVLLNQNWERFEEVLAPKVLGAWHLHRQTLMRSPKLFVLFSSNASLLGSFGQGNHAAANMFLDMLAHHRQAIGLPAISINWGGWSQVGAAARRQNQMQIYAAQKSLGWISPERGVEVLHRIIAGGSCQIGVVPVNWETFCQSTSETNPFLSEVAASLQEEGGIAKLNLSGFYRRLERAPTEERLSMLIEYLREEFKKVLQLRLLPEIGTGFRDLGMDSLMAVEIRNRLRNRFDKRIHVPSTIAFDYPNIAVLAKYLADQVDFINRQESLPIDAEAFRAGPRRSESAALAQHHLAPDPNVSGLSQEPDGLLSQLDDLSDDEAAQLLLSAITGKTNQHERSDRE
jgi:acyl carrier protein